MPMDVLLKALCTLVSQMFSEQRGALVETLVLKPIQGGTLPPIIMEVENYPICKETNIGGTRFPLP